MAVSHPDIVIGRGALADEILVPRDGRTRVAILSQDTAMGMARPLGERLAATGLAVEVIALPDGEAAKTLEVAQDVYLALNRMGMTRHDSLVAVGGGSVTDLGGFVAATYLRGIEAVYCPTTLLGAVDAAIGGKTGVNVGGKNLVGVFAHPTRIVIDLEVLAALPAPLMRQGMAEVLKAGLVGDLELVALLERDGLTADLEAVVGRAVDVKVAVVRDDFREAGRRAILNYGHTIGHAVEVSAGLSHGEAVAIGMVAAGAVSEELTGFAASDRQTSIIEKLGLPTSAPALDRDEAKRLVGLDKKRDSTGVRMVLLEAIGHPVVKPVDDATIDLALDAVTAPSEHGQRETGNG
ncbi:MAG: 3-dehydroquinate synthase [Acidimicrobiia bacterium]|nr:3-dehydroquinate synthase [Acidimicrobiia bacterium]